ncbi:MAG: HD-GYP domain-containing protein [Bacillota bacterium]
MQRPRAVVYYVLGTSVIAIASLYAALRGSAGVLAVQMLPLAVLSALFAYFPVRVGRETQVDFVAPLGLAFIVIQGPATGAAGVLLGVLLAEILLNRREWIPIAFNVSLVAIEVAAASFIFRLSEIPTGESISGPILLVIAVMAVANWAVNVGFFSGLISLLSQTRYSEELFRIGKSAVRHILVDALATVLFVSIYQSIGPAGLLIMAALLLLVRYGFQTYYRLIASYEEILVMLISILDARDTYTAGHSQRVSDNAVSIATEMRLPPSVIEEVKKAGLLHDIGKVNVPDQVLKKPGKLTDEETNLMNRHPTDGARFVESVSSLRHLAPIIRHHHERYDGRGYPDGLSGEAIPLGARILLVADAFDAMTTDRPYRTAMSTAEALGRIITNAGTQFDARVALAALRVLGKDLAESPQLEAAARVAATQQDKVSEASE